MTVEIEAREYRYERKFFSDELDAPTAIGVIKVHPAMFSQIYPPRYINNIYLDSPLMDNYTDNVSGAPERVKARIRWYHELFGVIQKPVLEFKIKKGWMGTKIQYDLSSFTFDRNFSEKAFKEMLSRCSLPADVRQYLLGSEAVLVNRYRRWYFATPDRHFRVTVDTGLTFLHLNKIKNQFLFRQSDQRAIVVELKYAREYDPEADRISSGFPFRMTRSSKYVQGIERVYL